MCACLFFVVLIETDLDFGVESRLGLCAEEACLGQGGCHHLKELNFYWLWGHSSRCGDLSWTRLAEQGQDIWEEEQGGSEFVKERALEAAYVAARAAQWSELVLAQVRSLLPAPGRLEAARALSRERAVRRRQDAARAIRRRNRTADRSVKSKPRNRK